MPRITVVILGLFLVSAGQAQAQPVVTGAVNAASFALAGLPNGPIAQGSIFTVFGRGLGPESLQQATSFPLPATLGGASMRVTVGGVSTSVIMIYVFASQAAAILPSSTPVGNGTLTVTFNNQTSAPFPIRVARSSFGVFAINQGGSGPGIVTDPNYVVNTLLQAANPGEVVILWGTGLGPVSGDEAAGPLPGDQNLDVQVFVGGLPAQVTYRGRSGCCAGLDQLVFTIPVGVEGCAVPVVVVIGGIPSNFTSISIAPSGRVCSDPGGLSAQLLQTAQTNGNLRLGLVELVRQQTIYNNPPPLPSLTLRADAGMAAFVRYTANQLLASQDPTVIPAGSCNVFQFSGEQPNFTDPVRAEALDAGPGLVLTGPLGVRQIARAPATARYAARVGGGGPEIPGLGTGFQPDYLEAGSYTINNGAGTSAVGPFSAQLTIGAELIWTNRGNIRNVNRSQPLTVTWTGGDPAAPFVAITGYAARTSARIGAAFICRSPSAAGTFTIPVEVLASLPATETQEGLPTGGLGVDAAYRPVSFSATGLDAGFYIFRRRTVLPVAFQ